jgi:hypothetical protein
MADRSKSPAYAALTASGKQVLRVIEAKARHGGAAITLGTFMSAGMCRSSARSGVKQCLALGFVVVTTGVRRVGQFELAEGWRGVTDARSAKRLVKAAKLPAQRQSRTPHKRVEVEPTVEPMAVKVIETVEFSPPESRTPSMPTLAWLGR